LLNFALNSKAFLIEHSADLVEFVGNRTECALLMLGRRWGADYKTVRDLHQPNVAHVSCAAVGVRCNTVATKMQ
jgi:Ca2+-transporting ATPase